MRVRECALVLAMLASLGLAGCNRGDSHPGAQANAPASPATTAGANRGGQQGTQAMGGPGTGLYGGLAPGGAASQPTPVAPGSSNTTTHGSVGNR
jgi:hypothetical protein